MLAIPDGKTSSGATHYKMIGKYCTELQNMYPDAIKIPCGKCRACRASKCRMWADRMTLELDHSKSAVFLTLTYDDKHVPLRVNPTSGESALTLNKRDLTLFFKRLRKAFPEVEIRYYACGEYGKNGTHRPHYHIILYPFKLNDFQFKTKIFNRHTREYEDYEARLDCRGYNELGYLYYSSNYLEDLIWKNGFVWLTEVSWNACAYVARYVKKKDYGFASDEYKPTMREPEFSVMSRNPGIGMFYPKEHPDFTEFSKIPFGDTREFKEIPLPSAFLETLAKTDPLKYVELKDQRYRASLDAELNRIRLTDLSSMELAEMNEDRLAQSEEVIDFYRNL